MDYKELEDYFYDRATEEQSSRVEDWLVRHADDDQADELLKQLLERQKLIGKKTDVERAFRRFRQRIASSVLYTAARSARRKAAMGRAAQWAAVIAVIVTLGTVTLYYRQQSKNPREWVEQYTALGETKKVTLPDNSTVWLNVGSKVIYPKKFNNHIRQIYVTGEVLADIKKNDSRPFVLSVGEVSIKVVGTKFNVRSYLEDTHIEVTLVEGAIDLEFAHNNNTSVHRLRAGEVANFDRATGKINWYDVEPAKYKSWAGQGGLYFRNLTLKDIAHYLERYFMVKIVVADSELLDYTFYASFVNNEGVDQILETLNSSATMKIGERNGIIYINKARR